MLLLSFPLSGGEGQEEIEATAQENGWPGVQRHQKGTTRACCCGFPRLLYFVFELYLPETKAAVSCRAGGGGAVGVSRLFLTGILTESF